MTEGVARSDSSSAITVISQNKKYCPNRNKEGLTFKIIALGTRQVKGFMMMSVFFLNWRGVRRDHRWVRYQ